MSSDLFIYDDSLFRCSTSDLFSDAYSPFSDSPIHQLAHQLAPNSLHNPPLQSLFYDAPENVDNILQRSFSNAAEKPDPFGFGFQAQGDALMESPDLQIRRVFSTGDLQNCPMGGSGERSLSENSLMEDASFKVGRYSAEERRERISKYRAKRTQRNFNKTIKYACRKTLADNRPRIRGRFARNDELGEIPKAACSSREDEDDDLWMEGMHGGEEGKMYGQMQFQYCGF